jgi:hypothetical protein
METDGTRQTGVPPPRVTESTDECRRRPLVVTHDAFLSRPWCTVTYRVLLTWKPNDGTVTIISLIEHLTTSHYLVIVT